MQWNRSEFYALTVGRLADRISGAGQLHRPLPDMKISTATVTRVQTRLNALGYDAGKPDGILGPGTRRAVQRFQKDRGLLADGFPSPETLQSIDGPRPRQASEASLYSTVTDLARFLG